MAATINDVAKLAGVSPKTVSNVVHDHPHVRTCTRVRVEQAIETLGYQPNIAARSLVTKRHNLIGFILWDILNPGYTEMVEIIIATAREQGYMLIVGNAGRDTGEEERMATLLIQQQVDGIILASATRESRVPDLLAAADVPVVMVSRHIKDYNADYVVTDNIKGGFMVTRHLIALGHRRIAFVRGTPAASTSEDREEGYHRALIEHGLEHDAALTACGNYTSRGAYIAARDLLSHAPRPTALVCANDLMAIAVIDAVIDSGLRVPEDVAVTGYDDIAWAASRSLALTTVNARADLMARDAVHILLQRIRKQIVGAPRHVVLPPELVVRRTCGASLPSRAEAMPRTADIF